MLSSWGINLVLNPQLLEAMCRDIRQPLTIADLTIVYSVEGGREIFADLLIDHDPKAGKAALVGWAASVGYRRLWLPSGMIDLSTSFGTADSATAVCRVCGTRYLESHSDFWGNVMIQGGFPVTCRLCGAQMPQWKPAPGKQGGDE